METSCLDEASSASISTSSLPATPPKPCSGEVERVGESGGEAESRKLPSSQYKGVVPQPNGRWGAQIYEKHRRVWLGTFEKEVDAAKAYDVAAQRFRGRDAVTNFNPLSFTGDDVETHFLNSRSKTEIVDMLRKHTYDEELHHCKRNFTDNGGNPNCVKPNDDVFGDRNGGTKARENLFEKVVTPSDVGKLNRLVIPKQHAEKHFPLQVDSACKGMLLNFEDAQGKIWRFRYSYWNSSQSYVLTKGWSRFVKEKGLNAGDIVSFHRSIGPEKQLYISWNSRAACYKPPPQLPLRAVRLFGVNIFEIPVGGAVHGGDWNGKREREMEIFPCEWYKKQCIEAL